MKRKSGGIRKVTFALVGCGDTGRAFFRLLRSKRREIASKYELQLLLTGVATGAHGFAIDPNGLDGVKALRRLEAGKSLDDLNVGPPITDTLDFIRRRPADVLFEITPLDPFRGQPAIDHIKSALKLGVHVVTANKGPVALAHRELHALAEANQCCFRFEGTVMDGAPVFNLVGSSLPGSRIQGFYGILNSTTNFVLTEIERGRSFRDSLKRARTLGITEADSAYDIDGWDAATKTAVLANVLLGGRLSPDNIERTGIASIGVEDLAQACRDGKTIRFIARACREGRTVRARVGPEDIETRRPVGPCTRNVKCPRPTNRHHERPHHHRKRPRRRTNRLRPSIGPTRHHWVSLVTPIPSPLKIPHIAHVRIRRATVLSLTSTKV